MLGPFPLIEQRSSGSLRSESLGRLLCEVREHRVSRAVLPDDRWTGQRVYLVLRSPLAAGIKGKADGDKPGWFALWRERRKANKLRAREIGRRVSDARDKDAERRVGHNPEREFVTYI